MLGKTADLPLHHADLGLIMAVDFTPTWIELIMPETIALDEADENHPEVRASISSLLVQQEPLDLSEVDDFFEVELTEEERLADEWIAGLPQSYGYDPEQQCIVRHKANGDAVVVCALLTVTARLRAKDTQPARLAVSFLDDDGQRIDVIVRADDLGSSSPSASKDLRNAGLHVPASDKELGALLRLFRAPLRDVATSQPGWLDAPAPIFCLPDGTLIAKGRDAALCPPNAPKRSYDPAATDGWNAAVAPLLRGNSVPIFAVCVALSGPLLSLSGSKSFGFNLAAPTSRGKSTALTVAAHVWPKGDLHDWGGTRAALDDLCLAAEATFLALDEIPTKNASQAQDMVYSLFNGRRRNARVMPGTDEPSAEREWILPIFTTSENTLAQTVIEEGVKKRGGVQARLAELDAEFLEGHIWAELNGQPDSDALTNASFEASKLHAGSLGPAFVWNLVGRERPWKEMLAKIKAVARQEITAHLGVDPDQVKDDTMRVIGYFATVMTAGYLATTFKVLPFDRAEISTAVLAAARCWQATRVGVRPLTSEKALKALRKWVMDEGRKRLAEIDENGRPVRARNDVDGWWDAEYYYLQKSTFERLSKGAKSLSAFRDYLVDLGIMLPGGTQGSCQVRMGSKIAGRPWVYRLDRHILDDVEEE